MSQYKPVFDERTAEALAIAAGRGNDVAQSEFSQDMIALPDFMIAEKYGPEMVQQRRIMDEAKTRNLETVQTERNIAQVAGDTAAGAASGFVGMVGSVGSATFGLAGAVDEYFNPKNTGLSEYATRYAENTNKLTGWMNENLQSDELQAKRALSQAQGALDSDDSARQYQRDLENGDSAFIAGLSRVGRDVVNSGGRILSDRAVAGDVIANALGSLGPSAKLAAGASNMVKGSQRYINIKLADSLASTTSTRLLSRGADAVEKAAIAASVGISEASGAYTGAVGSVMEMGHDELMEGSADYQDLISQGVEPSKAKAIVASDIGVDAFLRQFPTAAAMGILVSRFEAAPIQSFKGAGLIGTFRSVGLQTLEEGGQEGSGTYNENVAVRDGAQPDLDVLTGVGEGIATGMIGGAGMSGALAAPSIAVDGTIATAKGTIGAAKIGGSLALNGIDAASRIGSAAMETPAGQAGIKGIKTAATAAKTAAQPAMDAVKEYNEQGDPKLQSEAVQAGVKASELMPDLEKTDSIVPQSFKDNVPENANVIERVTGIVSSFNTGSVITSIGGNKGLSVSKISDGDALYALNEIQQLRNLVTTMPENAKAEVQKILDSSIIKRLETKALNIDLNKSQSVDTEITPEVVQTSLGMAKTNPVNSNPDVNNKILNHESRKDLTEEDIKFLETARDVSRLVNNHQEVKIGILNDKEIALSKKPTNKGKEPTLVSSKDVSRSIQVDGFAQGAAPSVTDMVNDIFAGAQSKDGKINKDGYAIDSKKTAAHFKKFATHMINKVNAMSQSAQQRDNKGRGPDVAFDSLNLASREIVKAGDARAARPVFYNADSPKSVEIARNLENDARITVEVYNRMVDAFPEMFPEGKLSVPQLDVDAPQTDLSVTSDSQNTEQTPVVEEAEVIQETTENTTAVEEEIAPAISDETAETTTDLSVNEIKTEADFEKMSDEQILESVNSYEADVQNLTMKQEVIAEIRGVLNPVLEKLGFDQSLVRMVAWLKSPDKNHIGQAYWAERLMSLKPTAVKRIMKGVDAGGMHILYHELMHIIDAKASKAMGKTASMSNAEFDPAFDGEIYAEVMAVVNSDPEMDEYFEYALSFKTSDELSSELFAEIGALIMIAGADQVRQDFPKGVAYVESIIKQAGGNIEQLSTEQGSDPLVSEVDPIVSITGDARTGATEVGTVSPKFSELFQESDKELPYQNADELLTLVQEEKTTNVSYVEYIVEHLSAVMDRANERLTELTVNSYDKKPIATLVKEGVDLSGMLTYKPTILINPETGQYDPKLLSLATITVLDWLTGANPIHASMLDDTLEDLGLKRSKMTRDQIRAVLNGVSVREAAEQIAVQIEKAWGVDKNIDAAMVDLRGTTEGLAKELLTVLTETTDLVSMIKVPVMVDGVAQNADSLSIEGYRDQYKDKIGLGAKNAIQRITSPETLTMPSVGEKITRTDQTQSRGKVPLSPLETAALKRMQDTPHTKAAPMISLVQALGFDAINVMLGFRDNSDLAENHPLRSSIEGKNLSILRDYEDAMAIVAEIDAVSEAQGTEGDVPVYYRVGISKVGRHQFKGINPQNNKILRALVTPTHSTLDMKNQEDSDAFWLTVAQSSGLGKVENKHHSDILSDIQEKFQSTYGEAVQVAMDFLKTGNMDAEAFKFGMGITGNNQEQNNVTMTQIGAVLAVAQLRVAQENGTDGEFQTSLSFELDGKTNGPANMMNNFGQGILTIEEFINLQRIGYFLGTKNGTLNNYYGDGVNKDLYNSTSVVGESKFHKAISKASGSEKTALYALQRFSAYFGDFEIVKNKDETYSYKMTRDTSKNPMTKTVYGSGVKGVGEGIAQDMMLEFYNKLQDLQDGDNLQDIFYPEIKDDIKEIFGDGLPDSIDKFKFVFNDKQELFFETFVTKSLGTVLSESAKQVIGERITNVNDTLVFITGIQSAFLQEMFDKRLAEVVEDHAQRGLIKRAKAKDDPKEGPFTGKGSVTQISQRAYDAVVEEIRQYSPTYSNGDQTLALASFSRERSNVTMSAAMDGSMRQTANMAGPTKLGVKIIPYISIGRGDAMMMNEIFGAENAPSDVISIFDGIDMPVNKVKKYAEQINAAVAKNWDRDVLGDIVTDFERFLDKAKNDPDMLARAFANTQNDAKNTTVTAQSVDGLLAALKEAQRQNLARTNTFKEIPSSIDQMGGSGTAYTRGPDGEMTREQINKIIQDKLRGRVTTPVEPTDQKVVPQSKRIRLKDSIDGPKRVFQGEVQPYGTNDVLIALWKGTKKKHVKDTVRVLMKLIPGKSARVIVGSMDAINDWRMKNITDATALVNQNGMYDIKHNTIFLTTNNDETVVHELIHMATFQKVLEHFEGQTNDAVTRLDALMIEFMGIDFSKSNKRVREAVNAARSQIIKYQVEDTAFNKAAALNEFMAWTMSNEALMKELKETPTGLVAKLSKMVKALMQRILGGVPTDMFSNILFNMEIINGPNEVESDTGNGGNSGGDNNNGGEVTPPAHEQTNFWIELIKQKIDEARADPEYTSSTQRSDQLERYRNAAINAVNKLEFGGFSLSPYQKQTFKAIHMVLATEMRLNTPSALAMNKVYEYITNNLTPQMFGPNNAQNRYSAVMELLGDTKNDEGVSDALATLLALSQTSQGFRNALDQLPPPESDVGGANPDLNEVLTKLTAFLMKKSIGTIDMEGKNVKEMMDILSENLIRNDGETEYNRLSFLMNNLNKADKYVNGALGALAERAEKLSVDLNQSNSAALTKFIGGSLAHAAMFMSERRAEDQADLLKRQTHMGKPLTIFLPIQELISEMVGTDKTNAEVVAMLDVVNDRVQAMRQTYREDLPAIFKREFKVAPTKEMWRAFHKGIGKVDIASQFDFDNPNAAFNLYSDKNKLSNKIRNKEAVINKNFSANAANDILLKAQQLARYMNEQGAGHQLWRNAYAMNMLAGDYKPNMTKEIDALITFYAIEMLPQETKDMISEAYATDPEAMKNMVVYMQALNKEEDMKTISDEARMNGFKGYIPDLSKGDDRIVIEYDSERENMEKMGFVRVGDYQGESTINSNRLGYYKTSVKQQGTYSQGVMQNVRDSYRGVDATTGLTIGTDVSGVIGGVAVDTITDEMNLPNSMRQAKETLMPIFNADRAVMYYERAINPDMIKAHTVKDNNLAVQLGVWAGRQVEEKLAQTYNSALITELKKIYDAREPTDDQMFVNMATDRDPIYKDSWSVITPESKEMIVETFGGENIFMVRRDMVNLALGYRDPSIVDMWNGKTRMPEPMRDAVQAMGKMIMGNKAVRNLAVAEGAVKGTVSTAKQIIVTKSLIVPYLNIEANVFQLKTRGVPFKAIIDGTREMLAEIEQANRNIVKKVELEAQITFAGTDKNRVAILRQQIQVIEDQNARFFIAPLLEAGAYKQISEGMTDLDVEITSGKFMDWVQVQTDKLPSGVQTVAKYGLLTKDTALYQGANKAVLYGDFIAKAIYYKHLIGQGVDSKTAIRKMNQEFVNYSVLPGRTRTALESIGATWFMSFKIRIMKIAMNQLRENPVRSLIVANAFSEVGSPVGDNLGSVIAGDRLGYSLGWDMMFRAPELNPFVSMIDWATD